jgi:predicted amidohydrolase YtcJ
MLTIRQARGEDGRLYRITLSDGLITDMAREEAGYFGQSGQEWDAGGRLILPALHDHHLHIMASLAQRQSVDLRHAANEDDICRILAERAEPSGTAWLRLVGLDDGAAGLPDRHRLDRWTGARQPARLQDRTGACWVLNSAALRLVGDDLPEGAERGADGTPTGRFWRADDWLRQHMPLLALDPSGWSAKLACYGVTSLTDASVSNGPEAAVTISAWRASGALQQQIVLMGGADLPVGESYQRGPLKILYDERDVPDFDDYQDRIRLARRQGRAVAAHVVTEGELALYLAALDAAGGAQRGDRIEHGSLISVAMIAEIAARDLIVVSNPVFLHDRGDRYVRSHDAAQMADLYRLGSLQRAGIRTAAASDAPYGDIDPWRGMRAARDRRSAGGHVLSGDEALSARAAMALYWGHGGDLAAEPRRVAVGQPADFIFCHGDMADVLTDLSADRVAATFCRDRFLSGGD